jgi:hypothetical protein
MVGCNTPPSIKLKSTKMAKETFESTFKVGSIEERLYTTISNIKHPAQKNRAMWDDLEKLDHVFGLLALGKSIQSPFRFLTDKEYKKVFNR